MQGAVLDSRDYEADALREQVSRVTSSKTFSGSSRHKRFLEYVVEKAIQGRTAELKGYTLAVEVFDRAADFDPHLDPIVRIEAGRLRRSLERYYLTEGKRDPILIDIPKGAYVPIFAPQELAKTSQFEPASSSDVRPDPPSIVVLSFRNLGIRSGNRAAQFLSEEVSVGLAHFRHINVVPSTMSRQSSPTSAIQFTLGGSVRLEDEVLYVTAWLVDTATGTSVWSDTFDTSATSSENTAALKEIAATITAEVGHPRGSLAQFVTANEVEGSNPCLALYKAYRYGLTRDGTKLPKVRAALRVAITNDPRNSAALALLSILELDRSLGGTVGWTTNRADLLRALEIAETAVEVDPYNAVAHQAILEAHFRLGHVELALDSGREAVRLNPNHSTTLAVFGALLCYSGNWDEGQPYLRKSRLLVHQVPYWYRIVDVFGHYRSGEYRRALRVAEGMKSRCIIPPTLRAMLYGKLRMTRKGSRELHKLLEVAPGISRKDVRAVFSLRNFDNTAVDHFMKHLEFSGLNDIIPAK